MHFWNINSIEYRESGDIVMLFWKENKYMNAVKVRGKTPLRVVIFIVFLSIVLSGCSSIDSNKIVSHNNIDFNRDSRMEKLIVNLVDGNYQITNEAGTQTVWNWEGRFAIQLIDSKNNLISTVDLNNVLNRSKLYFNGMFTVEFDDYNGDGSIDFSIGQYGLNNRFEYSLFTIKGDGKIEPLSIEGGYIISYYEGYSTRFKKTDNDGFKSVYFNSATNKNVEVTYEWQQNQFIRKRVVEFEVGKEPPEDTEEVIENIVENEKEENEANSDKEDKEYLGKEIIIPDLNNEENGEIVLPLIDGMIATRTSWSAPEDFNFREQENKDLKDIYEYIIYDENDNEIGWFGLVISQQEEDSFNLPENLQFEDLRYNGPTKLGKGKIFLLWLEPTEKQAAEEENKEAFTYTQEYFAYIPVENEDLAYSLRLKVPEGDKVEEIFSYVKKIIVIDKDVEQEVHEIFKNGEPQDEDIENFFQLLPYMDWVRLAGIENDIFFNIIKWLQNYDYEKPEHIGTVLVSTNGLDGIYAEAYSYMLKELFLKEKQKFINAMLNIENEQRELISFYIAYAIETSNDAAAIKYLETELLQEEKYLDEEKQIIQFILEALGIGV